MKNFTFGLFMLLTLIGTSAFAQIPNAGFETWVTPSGASFTVPEFWATSNESLSQLPVPAAANVTQETGSVAEGTSAVKLTSTGILGGFAVASGAISSGNITYDAANTTLTFDGGFPFTERPGQLVGKMKYTPVGTDSAYIWVLLTRWNTATSARETVGFGAHSYATAVAAYETFGVTIDYTSTEFPDTALIVALSTKKIVATGAAPGSTLWLDDLSFEFGAGVNGLNNVKTINAYPNPATDVLNIEMNAGDYTMANVYDMTGRLVNTLAIEGTSVNVSSLNDGQYVMEMSNNNGRVRLIFAKQ